MTKHALITGGAGFIGSHTADALIKKGFKIRIVDNLEPPVHDGRWPKYVLGKGYELVKADVRERRTWEKILKGVTHVWHMAAYQDQRLDFSTFFTTNVVGASYLYEIAVVKKLPIKKITLASSQFVYGDGEYQCRETGKTFFPELRTLEQFEREEFDILCPHPPAFHEARRAGGKSARFMPFREDQTVRPPNSYALSKYAQEMLALRLGKTYGIPTTALRYSIVQGARQSPRNLYSGALRIFVSEALAGVPITVYEDGRAKRDFVNVHDVVSANMLSLTNRKTDYETFNVGGGKAHAVIDFARLVKRITESPSEIVIGGFRRTDTRNAVSDISKLKKLGWHPRFTTEDSVKEYVAWYKAEGFHRIADKNKLEKLKEGIRR